LTRQTKVVLECSGCGERVILLGYEDDWSREHRHAFGCIGCTKTVTLADRIDGMAYTMKSLPRSSMKPLKLVS